MGYEYHCLVAGTVVEALQEQFFGLRVQGGTELVQQEYASRTQQGAGYGYALRLTFAESASGLEALAVQTLGHPVHEIGGGAVERLPHLAFVGIGLAHKQVLAYAAAEERIALRDIYHIAACPRRGLGAVAFQVI